MNTVYDVTTFPASVAPAADIGRVINEILAEVRSTQTTQTTRPGAVIYIPPGHYDLHTPVVIDISYVQIKGSGHGFQSLAIRDESNTSGFYDVLPGASHVQVRTNGPAFIVRREGNPQVVSRINSVEFRDFIIDGVAASKPYLPGTGKVGIDVQTDNDSIRIEGMGFVYLSRGVVLHGADAAWVTNCFIAECGSCVELTGASQVCRISNNYLISAWAGHSVFAENAEGVHITGNTMVWHGSVRLVNCHHAAISANKFVSSWPGMVVLEGPCRENLITGNQFTRVDTESDINAGRDDYFGMVQLAGSGNTVSANHFSSNVAPERVRPSGAIPTAILVKSGSGNYLATNNFISNRDYRVVLDASTTQSKVLWSGAAGRLNAYSSSHSFVPTP